jgi:hypothetical protein
MGLVGAGDPRRIHSASDLSRHVDEFIIAIQLH